MTEQQRLRDNFLLETNFDEDGALTMVHTQNNRSQNNDLSGASDMRNRIAYRSNMSVDRYSDTTLHGVRGSGENFANWVFKNVQQFFFVLLTEISCEN